MHFKNMPLYHGFLICIGLCIERHSPLLGAGVDV